MTHGDNNRNNTGASKNSGRDGNDRAFRYLKWENNVVGIVMPNLSVSFTSPNHNETVALYTHGSTSWSPEEFLQFLSERIMSPSRRDIERLLFRCGLSEYDTFKIADATHAINPRDELWLAHGEDDLLSNALTDVFDAVFTRRIDAIGDSVNTPEGANTKHPGQSRFDRLPLGMRNGVDRQCDSLFEIPGTMSMPF